MKSKNISQEAPSVVDQVFAQEVMEGLQAQPKNLPSKYFYDERGDELFQQIMNMPEYYLTNCEYEIFEDNREDILQAIGNRSFDLIELGAGDGYKTKVLLKHFLERKADFHFCPVDISDNVLQILNEDLKANLPGLYSQPLQGDYFEVLDRLSENKDRKKVILFLGGNIGNLETPRAKEFLRAIGERLDEGDDLLIGFDLKKDPETIWKAYNDPAGITAAFNLNLLTRINRELDANFDTAKFKHWETYNPLNGETRSYLISKEEQEVCLAAVREKVTFKAWEAINVELSQKYSLSGIEAMAETTGYHCVRHFYDRRRYFVDSMWRK